MRSIRFLLLYCAFALLPALGSAMPKGNAPVPPEIENPTLLGVNKEPYHAVLMPYATVPEALAADRHRSSFCQSLNGLWKFNWVAWPQDRPVDFYKPGYDVGAWKDITVPSNWQTQEYGTPFYSNMTYTFQANFPKVMDTPSKSYTAYNERNPVGSYRREFEVPAAWAGRRVFITFDGVDSGFFLWINGEKAGYSVNSRNAAEFDITKYLKPGKNVIAAEVYQYTSGIYFEDQDMWRLSGIFRNVTLWSSPQVHLRDFFLRPDLDAQYQNGSLSVTAKIRNYGATAAPAGKLALDLYDRDQKSAVPKAETVVPALGPGEEKEVAMQISVASPAKWTAETPSLYTAVLTLGNGVKTGEIISKRIGFRKIEIQGRVFTINGVPVKLKGANRHENSPDGGHYVTEEHMIRDLEMLKRANCNHVRTSHYSNDPRWYELCDQWGIYLNAEANIEFHGLGRQLTSDPRCLDAILDRETANVENFKNSPSVVMWSLGNESADGTNFTAGLQRVKSLDESRPVHYEPFGVGPKNPADVDSQMYTNPDSLRSVTTDPKFTKPFYLCEYAHAMFNSMGSMKEYNELFDNNPCLMGGAIWEWEDQGIWNRRDPNRQFLAYGGGFGETPNDKYFIHKGVVFSDRSPKPHYPEVKHQYQWIAISAEDLAAGIVKIRNKYQFIPLDGFKGSWTVSEDGRVIEQGELSPLHLAPLSEQSITIPFRKITPKPGAEYFLRVAFALGHDEVWAPAGYEVASEQFKLPAAFPAAVADTACMAPVKLEQDARKIIVSGKNFSVEFDKAEGTLSQLVCDGKALLAPGGGPRLQPWRAPHQKDDMWAYDLWKRYNLPDLKRSTLQVTAEAAGENAVRIAAVVKAEGNEEYTITHSAVYTVYGDGSIAVDNAVSFPKEPRIPLARIGVRMLLQKTLDQFSYLGRGPMENYSDRKTGFDVGLYSSSVAGQLTPYAKPMECGNHEDVRWALVSGSGLPGCLVQAGGGGVMQVSALPYTDEQMTPVEYSIDLPPSTATVLNICEKTLGVGSSGCGPRPLPPYMVWSDSTAFSYVIRLVPAAAPEIPTRLSAPQNRVQPVLSTQDNADRVSLTCATPGARLEYALPNGAFQLYTGPFAIRYGKEPTLVSVRAGAPEMQPYTGALAFPPEDPRVHWTIVSCSSFQKGEGDPIHAIDNRSGTYWHTQWNPSEAKYPHELVIDFGKANQVKGIAYEARDDGSNGRVKDYEVYFSDVPNQWGAPAIKGQFRNKAGRQTADLAHPVSARYMKFVALSEVNGRNFAAVAELNIIAVP